METVSAPRRFSVGRRLSVEIARSECEGSVF